MERGEYGAVNVYKQLLDQARPYWGGIGGILLLNLLATPLSLLKPLALIAHFKRLVPEYQPNGMWRSVESERTLVAKGGA